MLIKDINDDEVSLREIAGYLKEINPDQVHVVQPTRPSAETWVRPPNETGLERAHMVLGEVAKIILPAEGTFNLSGEEDLVEAIMGIITRHPMKESEINQALSKWPLNDIRATLHQLVESGKAQLVNRGGVLFWSASDAYYANGKHR
jgi:wyosine [tRNA(Phe)-imidazoG37] synthetase (radical SAM superfamily)